MFLVNSRLGHFSAPYRSRVRFSRSYAVNLPSSLAMIHSSTLGYSPHPPVSVYGTGRDALDGRMIFSQVCLPALSALPKLCGTVGFQSPYALQRGLPSPRGCVTPRSHAPLHHECRNINRLAIRFASRLLLRSRLTLIRLTLFRKPGVFGVNISIFIVVTYAYIFFSRRSSKPRGSPSTLTGMLPYHACCHASKASAAVLMPAHHPCNSARPVSCYALFE